MTRGKTTPLDHRHRREPTATRGWVAFVGSGPGDPGLLTVRAADLLREADVVITESPDHEALVRSVRGLRADRGEAGPELVDGGFGEDGQPLTHAARAKVVVKQAKRGLRVVRLMTGDPFLYASGPEEALACAKAGLGFEVVPGVSSLGSVPAYAGIPLTTKDHRELTVVSVPREGRLEPYAGTGHARAALGRQRHRRHRQAARRRRPRARDAGADDPRRHHHRPDHRRLHARPHRRRRARRPDEPARDHRRRRRGRPARDAVVVRDQAAVRLAGAGAPHQGAGRRAVAAAARLRRGARGGADHLGRAAAQPAADGQGRARPGRGSLRVDRLHLRQRRQGGAREVRGVRPRRPRLLRPQDRGRRRQDRAGHRRRGACAPTWCRRASSPPPGCWPTGRSTTTCSTRSTGSSCRAPTSPPRTSSPG